MFFIVILLFILTLPYRDFENTSIFIAYGPLESLSAMALKIKENLEKEYQKE
ncbi:MAG: hypothetical protein V1838_05145 [Patescibacteria group bacterium]